MCQIPSSMFYTFRTSRHKVLYDYLYSETSCVSSAWARTRTFGRPASAERHRARQLSQP